MEEDLYLLTFLQALPCINHLILTETQSDGFHVIYVLQTKELQHEGG